MPKSYLQNRFSGRELPKERPVYLDEDKWGAIFAHLCLREPYDVIAAREGVRAGAIRERCSIALARLRQHGDLKRAVPADKARLDAVILEYNRIMAEADPSIERLAFPREDIEWMIDTLVRFGG